MPSLDRLLLFSLAAALVIAVPGPSVIFFVSRALSSGQRVAGLSVLGNALGEYRGAGSVPPQIMLLGAIFAGIAVLSDSVWVLLAARFGAWFGRSPKRLELIGGAGGLAIAAIGTGLLITGRNT